MKALIKVAAVLAVSMFAAAPAFADGFTLGSLCVIDTRPRTLDDTQKQILASLAALASDEIKLRVTDRQLRRAAEPGASMASAQVRLDNKRNSRQGIA